MTTQLSIDEPQTALVESPAAYQANAVANLLQAAVAKGMDPEGLEKLVSLHERIMDRQAEAEFNAAMKAFQTECHAIGKTSIADTGKYKYAYASLDHVCDMIRPHIDRHGFSYSFNSESAESRITVTCIVAHIGGHKRATNFTAPIDSRAAMNDTQKFASAVSYGQRYALKLAFGLSFGDDDDAQLKPKHENPDQTPDAPQAKTRAERNPPKERPDSSKISKDEFAEFAAAWKREKGDDKAAFVSWCHAATLEDFGASDTTRWTWGRLKQCRRKMDEEMGVSGPIPF